jgi:hypothetical protein
MKQKIIYKSPAQQFDGFQIPRRLIQQHRLKNLSCDALLIFIYICHRVSAKYGTRTHLTDETIAQATGLTHLQIKFGAADLAATGLVLSEVTANGRSNYWLILS